MTIDGILYRSIEGTTIEHDHAIMECIRAMPAGVLERQGAESVDQHVDRLLGEFVRSGQMFPLLGCFLVPGDQPWTRSVMQETADKFRRLTDPGDKAALRSAFLPVLLSFFVTGLVSWRTSATSFLAKGDQPPLIAGRSRSASGLGSFVWWLGAILPRLLSWRGGRFVKRSSPTMRS